MELSLLATAVWSSIGLLILLPKIKVLFCTNVFLGCYLIFFDGQRFRVFAIDASCHERQFIGDCTDLNGWSDIISHIMFLLNDTNVHEFSSLSLSIRDYSWTFVSKKSYLLLDIFPSVLYDEAAVVLAYPLTGKIVYRCVSGILG